MIDLHTHTTCSDGRTTVPELLDEARRVGLTLLSITDHNTLDAYEQLKDPEVRGSFPGMILPGVELSTTYRGELVEVLGYGIDPEQMRALMAGRTLSFAEKQRREYKLILAAYRKIGVVMEEDNLVFNPERGSSRGAFLKEIRRHPENDRFFLDLANADSGGAFSRYELYNPRSPLYVDESSLFFSMDESVDMIHRAGGRAFLAHTYVYSSTIADCLERILDEYPLDGLECFYTTFTPEQTQHLVCLCRRRGLCMSGGSDFHGSAKPRNRLGVGYGDLNVDEKAVRSWVDCCGNLM
jgi:predicted metal-dependent phosphoesterase TrpH